MLSWNRKAASEIAAAQFSEMEGSAKEMCSLAIELSQNLIS